MKKEKRETKSNLYSVVGFDNDNVLPVTVYNAYCNAKGNMEHLLSLCDKYQQDKITLQELKQQAFEVNDVKEFITHVCDYFVSELYNKDEFIDLLYCYSTVFFIIYYHNIEYVINNIHNKAFNLAVSFKKENSNDLESYLSYVEKYLSTLTPKLTSIKQRLKEYQKQ